MHDSELACARHQVPSSAEVLEVKAFDVSGAAYVLQHLFFSTMVQVEFRVGCLELQAFGKTYCSQRLTKLISELGVWGCGPNMHEIWRGAHNASVPSFLYVDGRS